MSTCKNGHVDPPRNKWRECELCKPVKAKSYRKNTREQRREYQQNYRQTPDGRAAHRRGNWRKRGIAAAEAEAAFAAHDGACGICGAGEPGGGRAWHLDHDHATGRVRGVLCRECNLGLGHFRDSPEIARRAALYLEFHKCLT